MRSPHPAGVVAVRETPLDQLASLPKQVLPIRSVHPTPVRIDRLLLVLFTFPMSVALLFLLRNVRPYFRALHLHQHRTAMVALVGDHFLHLRRQESRRRFLAQNRYSRGRTAFF